MKIRLLSLLTQEERGAVKGLGCNKTSVLYRKGDLCTSLGIVISGQVQVVVSSPNGNDLIYSDLKSGDVFNNDILFLENPVFRGDVIALGKTTVALIEKPLLMDLFKNNSNFLMEYLRIESEKANEVNNYIKILDSDNVEDRFLMYIRLNGGTLKMKSIQDTANKIHVTREALSRSIKKLVERELIVKENNSVKIKK